MTTIGHRTNPPEAHRRQTPALRVAFAGAAAVAALALLCAAGAADARPLFSPTARSGTSAVNFAADGDDNFVNDNGQTPGDVFTQNAQDQSTA